MSSQASSPASPTLITEEISTKTISDVIKDFNTKELIKYLGRKDLKLKETHFKILRKEEITSLAFFKLTKEDFCSIGFTLGPATVLAEFIEDLGQKIRNYFSFKTLDNLKEMLRKNKVNGKDITNIKQFTPVFEEINDDDKTFEYCIEDIILKLSNMETMTDTNEVMHCEFISAILHASIIIAKNLIFQDIFIVLQKDISGKDVTGQVNYTIKSLEEFLYITEEKSRNIKIGYAQVSAVVVSDSSPVHKVHRQLKLSEQIEEVLKLPDQEKISEDMETDAFLVKVHKKSISNNIRKCNKEKKLSKAGQDQENDFTCALSFNPPEISFISEILPTSGRPNHVTKISETVCSKKILPEVNVSTTPKPAEISISTASIPSTHIFNSLSETSPVLEQFPFLYLSDSSECDERFDLNSSTLCPLCNGDHKEESLWKDIRDEWDDGDYCGE
ncbi:hypothetical protein C1645_743483 [Glomus cerebriforme]|uniref:SAM domain-containing protein n=1 Tax=Glomus cerebriforme TaxID=658196 RepID=A0A397SJ60_9GLOM|nr:hypothetical protein C1645_743483 [Glomus cerebriforme]